jgi:hypothetical protein
MDFGLYLKNKGVISAEQLVDALQVQYETLPPIGQLALEEGIVTARDIFDVLLAQSDSPSERFGELAVEMGVLKRDDVLRLLTIQADRKRPIVEILVRQGVLSQREVASELLAYRREQQRPRRASSLSNVVPPPVRREALRTAADTFAAV